MKRLGSALPGLVCLIPFLSSAQIDPIKRDLIQVGYNGAFEGHQPFSGYAFYYHNEPDFIRTNLTLRVALAPTYVDSELGISSVAPETDLGIGGAGGAFADSYNEIRDGIYYPAESFDGYGGETSLSLYHLFDPGRLIPLSLVLRGTAHYSAYARNSDTGPGFVVPNNHWDGGLRAGLRFGGVEPTLFPALAMELSVWYEGHLRTDAGSYGYSDDRSYNPSSQLFWGEAALSYTFSNTQQNVYVRLTAGTSIDADRFSAYRLGSFLPLIEEFPLSLPGYFYQEISAKQFVLLNANYLVPLDKKARWELAFNASTAVVDYLPGESEPGNWLNGVSGGLLWHSPDDRWKIMTDYAYGINAIRDNHRGASSVGILLQVDLGKTSHGFNVTQPSLWRGVQRIFD
jgi:hypothetical protein